MVTIVTRAGKGSPLTHAEVDADNFTMDFLMLFNGLADNFSGEITFARNASVASKTTQVRQLVNATLQGLEPGASSLNNANIQIAGMPT